MAERPLIASCFWLLVGAASFSCGGAPAAIVVAPPSAGRVAPSSVSASVGPAGIASPSSPLPAGAALVAAPGAALISAAPPRPPEHPFAATSLEATNLIDAAIDARASSLVKCVEAVRPRRKNPHAKILIEVGLDQEGHLLGVKAPAGAPADPELYTCAQAALQGANFPRSHAGIITVVKTFEEQAVYK